MQTAFSEGGFVEQVALWRLDPTRQQIRLSSDQIEACCYSPVSFIVAPTEAPSTQRKPLPKNEIIRPGDSPIRRNHLFEIPPVSPLRVSVSLWFNCGFQGHKHRPCATRACPPTSQARQPATPLSPESPRPRPPSGARRALGTWSTGGGGRCPAARASWRGGRARSPRPAPPDSRVRRSRRR